MNILLLGGSNAGLRDGWAAQLQQKESAHSVENRFLGAVGSLYGLMLLMKQRQEGARQPDAIVFEYCLNDVLLVDAGVIGAPLIADTLEAVAAMCAETQTPLVFLCLSPRPGDDGKARKSASRVTALYENAAKRADARILLLSEIFEGALLPTGYQDENHLTPQASSRVADAVMAAIENGVPAPRARRNAASRFLYVGAARARTSGDCRLTQILTRVFEGPFIELRRGGASLWPGDGRLAGLMLLSNAQSGVYRIRAGTAAYRKNARSQMQEIVPNLVLLHYSTRRMKVAREVEVALPDDEAALTLLPEDRTLLAVPATAAFAEQTLLIHGLMFWRPRSLIERLREFFKR
jgi:lysophospholipase L1-like esterase